MKSEQEWKIELQDILEKLRNNSINEIELRTRGLDTNGAKVLASALKDNRSLTSMDLTANQISAKGAVALAEALKENRSLTTIFLRGNNIGAKGASALAEALKENRSLTTVFLWGNNIGDAGAAALAEALKVNQSLTTMDLNTNNIGVKGATTLAEALKVNYSLTTMDVRSNNVGAEQEEIIKKYLDRNILCDQLHQAVRSGDLAKTQEYIQRGAELLSVRGKEENTPLHWAAAKGHVDIVKLLLEKMAEMELNFAIKNKDNQTPRALARKNGHEEIVQLLYGAKKVTQDTNNIAFQPPPTAEKSINDYLQNGGRSFINENYSESLQIYESALKLQPENVEALVHKGKVL